MIPEPMCHSEVIKSRGKDRETSNEHRIHPNVLPLHLPLVTTRELQQSKACSSGDRVILSTCSSSPMGENECVCVKGIEKEMEGGRDAEGVREVILSLKYLHGAYCISYTLTFLEAVLPPCHMRNQRLTTRMAQGHIQGIRPNSPAALTETIQTDMITRVAITLYHEFL